MSWQPELSELEERKALARQMGGAERIERQHLAGKLTVRERIELFLDEGSFREVGSITGVATYSDDQDIETFLPANSVIGRGSANGNPIVIQGDDFTIRGGSADAAIWNKMLMAERMAAEYRMPIVRLLEGSGGGGSVRTLEKTGRANIPNGIGSPVGFDVCAMNMGRVPVVALGLGSVAGLGAARLALSHYSVIVKGLSNVFIAGPPVVERLDGPVSKQDLGGWQLQTASGAVDEAAESEEEAFELARTFLSYLPSSVWELSERARIWDPPDRTDENLLSVVPRSKNEAYNMRRIVESVVDNGSFFEIGRLYGRPVIAGLARLDGWPVAIIAGDPLHAGGAWDARACQKLVRLIDMAETFHLPVVHLVDCPGLQVGKDAEESGLIRHGVRLITAMNQTTVPWCSVIVRNVFGVGGSGHQPHGRLAFRYAWPSARWGSLPLEGGVEAAYRAELDAADDPQAELAKIEARLEALRSPFRTAESFWVEEIIDPRETRPIICEFANLAARCRTPGPSSFAMRP